MDTARILVVEDEGIIAADLSDRLGKLGYTVIATVASGEKALQAAARESPDLVLMDIVLKGQMNGIEAAEKIRQSHDIPIVYLTSHADAATVQAACVTEPFGYVLKPFNERELQTTIQIALYRHRAEAKLRKIERWLATTLDSIGDAVIATDSQGMVTLLNPVAERLTGWRQEEAIGRAFAEVFHAIDGITRQPLESLVEKALREGYSIGLEEHVCLRTKGGGETPIDDSIAPIRDELGNVTGTVLVFRDCTERKLAEGALQALNQQLEHRVTERTAQLEAANKELAAFSYSISHDLRAPLRAVNGFSELLAEKYADLLDDEGKYFLQVVRRSSRSLGEMIDDFLRLFRLRNEPLRIRLIDMNQLLQDVIDDLKAHHHFPVNVKVMPLSSTHGDLGLIRQLWINLLGNAVKFTSKRDQPMIEVGGEEKDDHFVFYVKDNGAGFDMRYADKLFGVFQRLHRAEEFEGTGIGLAIVNRIVRMHGGVVRAEGKLDEGATFYFTLSKGLTAERGA